MAERRCFSNRIVGSDQFYALPETAQALYLHLNMAADDDGFVNSAGSIAARIKSGKTALARLVKDRFLLQFGEIYIVKHWRIGNSLKNDRLKPLNYPGVAAMVWIKPNRAYTDHPVDGCVTLYEFKTGRILESKRNPDGIQLESQPNRTELNRTELNRTEPAGGGFEVLWSEYPEHRRGDKEQAREAFIEFVQGDESILLVQENLRIWKQSEQWTKASGQYVPSLRNWLSQGTWQTVPHTTYSKRELDDEEFAAIQRMLNGGD